MSAFSCVPRGDVRNEKLQNPQLKAFKKTLEINNQFNLNPDLGLIKTFVLLIACRFNIFSHDIFFVDEHVSICQSLNQLCLQQFSYPQLLYTALYSSPLVTELVFIVFWLSYLIISRGGGHSTLIWTPHAAGGGGGGGWKPDPVSNRSANTKKTCHNKNFHMHTLYWYGRTLCSDVYHHTFINKYVASRTRGRWCRDRGPVINIVGWEPGWEAQEATMW